MQKYNWSPASAADCSIFLWVPGPLSTSAKCSNAAWPKPSSQHLFFAFAVPFLLVFPPITGHVASQREASFVSVVKLWSVERWNSLRPGTGEDIVMILRHFCDPVRPEFWRSQISDLTWCILRQATLNSDIWRSVWPWVVEKMASLPTPESYSWWAQFGDRNDAVALQKFG